MTQSSEEASSDAQPPTRPCLRPGPHHPMRFSKTIDITSVGALLSKRGGLLPVKLGVTFTYVPSFVRYGDPCHLTISSSDLSLILTAEAKVRSIMRDPQRFKEELDEEKINIVVDDSNFVFGGIKYFKQHSCPESSSNRGSYSLPFSKPWFDIYALTKTLQRGRWTERKVAIGSGNPTSDRWDRYKRSNYEIQVFTRTEQGRERGSTRLYMPKSYATCSSGLSRRGPSY